MTDIFITDSLEENWRNSEVMRAFAELYTSSCMCEDEAADPEYVELEQEEIPITIEIDEPVIDLKRLKASIELDSAVISLEKLASQLSENNMIREAYLVERTIDELRADIDTLKENN